jgi:nucleotide-binding universal stress UspA family protein
MRFNKILVPVAGTPADNGALDLACTLSKTKFRPSITALHVIPVERALPLDAEVSSDVNRAEEVMDAATKRIQKNGCAAEIDIIQAREVGPAIVQVAQEIKADLIVFALSYKTHYGEYCLGDVAPYVLKNAPCRVILDHQLETEQPE